VERHRPRHLVQVRRLPWSSPLVVEDLSQRRVRIATRPLLVSCAWRSVSNTPERLAYERRRGAARVVSAREVVPPRRRIMSPLSARLSASDGFLVAARALWFGLARHVAGLMPARRKLAHVHRAVLRVDAAATTRVPGYDVRRGIARVAVVHRHGVWIMPLPLRYRRLRDRFCAARSAGQRKFRPGPASTWTDSAAAKRGRPGGYTPREHAAERGPSVRLRRPAGQSVPQAVPPGARASPGRRLCAARSQGASLRMDGFLRNAVAASNGPVAHGFRRPTSCRLTYAELSRRVRDGGRDRPRRRAPYNGRKRNDRAGAPAALYSCSSFQAGEPYRSLRRNCALARRNSSASVASLLTNLVGRTRRRIGKARRPLKSPSP
jgi:hypothetical protein